MLREARRLFSPNATCSGFVTRRTGRIQQTLQEGDRGRVEHSCLRVVMRRAADFDCVWRQEQDETHWPWETQMQWARVRNSAPSGTQRALPEVSLFSSRTGNAQKLNAKM